MITVIAFIQLKPGTRDACLARLQQLVPQVLDEPDCFKYQPLIDADCDIDDRQQRNPDRITLLEHWSSAHALDDHLRTDHLRAYRNDVAEWVESVSLQVLEAP